MDKNWIVGLALTETLFAKLYNMSKGVGEYIYKLVKEKGLQRKVVAALANMTPGNLSKIYKRDEIAPSLMITFSKILETDLFALYSEELKGIKGNIVQQLSDENALLRKKLEATNVELERVRREADRTEKLYILTEEKCAKMEAALKAEAGQQDEEPIAQPEPKLYKAPPRKKKP